MMSNAQLYLSVGLPVLAILISLAIQPHSVSASGNQWITDRRTRPSYESIRKADESLRDSMERLDKSMDRFEDRLSGIRTAFIKDHTERIVRLESVLFRGQ